MKDRTWLRPWMVGLASLAILAGIAWAAKPFRASAGLQMAGQASWQGDTGVSGAYYKTGSGLMVRNPDNTERGPLAATLADAYNDGTVAADSTMMIVSGRPLVLEMDGITSGTTALSLFNATAATGGVPVQVAPRLHFTWQSWNGASSQTNRAGLFGTSGGAASDGWLSLQFDIGAGSFTNHARLRGGHTNFWVQCLNAAASGQPCIELDSVNSLNASDVLVSVGNAGSGKATILGDGAITAPRFMCSGTAPSCVLGAGAGTGGGATCSATGTGCVYTVTVTTGTVAGSGTLIATLTYATAYTNDSATDCMPQDSSTAGAFGFAQSAWYASSASTVTINRTAFSAQATYTFRCKTIGR